MNTKTRELVESIVDKLVAAIRNGENGRWEKPWVTIFGMVEVPVNALTKQPYRGFNRLAFGLAAAEHQYPEGIYATYRQWKKLGRQVVKGQKGHGGIKWGITYRCHAPEGCNHQAPQPCPTHKGQGYSTKKMWSSTFTVFNIAQTVCAETGDPYTPPEPEERDGPAQHAEAERLIAASGANITQRNGDKAYYLPGTNDITVPNRTQFETTAGWYGTLFHELTHYVGGTPQGLNRAQTGVFGSPGYAAEELVAELGAAMLSGILRVQVEPSMNHAAYLASWLDVLEADPMTLYRAARDAEASVEWLTNRAAALSNIAKTDAAA